MLDLIIYRQAAGDGFQVGSRFGGNRRGECVAKKKDKGFTAGRLLTCSGSLVD